MKLCLLLLACCLAAGCAGAGETGDPIDRLDEALTFSSRDGAVRIRFSGLLDLEEFVLDQPAPGLFETDGNTLFCPRLRMFLDGQLGTHCYVFAQARADRGFDPGTGDLQLRLDEYAVRLTPGSTGVLNLQLGKFATVVGNWVPRHDSWANPFVTAPLPYENVTGIFDVAAASSPAQLLKWAEIPPGPFLATEYAAQLRVPIIWGPSYATGAAVTGTAGRFDYAVEIKNASLSSRPSTWAPDDTQWEHPTFSGRVGFRPNAAWNFGLSASSGTYLQPSAQPTLAPGTDFDDYREVVVAQDVSYAWHHVQVWAEIFETRFNIPGFGPADTMAYYIETRFKFSPQFSGAIRWNQQLFGTIPTGTGAEVHWGRDTWRIDVAPAYRFTPHLQGKLQYSYQYHPMGSEQASQLFAAQLALRF
jgi:hypothetical protein